MPRFHSALFVVFCLLASICFASDCKAQHGYQLGFYPAEPALGLNGVKIQSLVPNSPMTRLSGGAGQWVTAESGDVIVSVNGMLTPNISTLKSVLTSMTGSTYQRTTIQLRNWRNGQIGQYTVIARRKGPSQNMLQGLIGSSESDAINRIRSLNFISSIRSRDGVQMIRTMDYRVDRVNLDIVNGVVTGASAG